MTEIKKFLDQEGVQYLWSKIAMEDYPNNDTLIAALNAIDETKADKDTMPDAYKEYAETTYAKIADLPTKTSQLENDSNFISSVSSSSKVLWLGTSIPSGDGVDPENTYPKMVEKMLGCKVYNNSRAGSFMAYYPTDASANWTTSSEVDSTGFVLGYSLTQTVADVDTKFKNKLNSIRSSERLPSSWVNNHLNDFKAHSYENLVLPYINGEIDTCDVVIIDHGFNDRSNIFNVAGQHPDTERDSISYWPKDQVGGQTVEYPVIGGNDGWYWLTHLSDSRYYDGFVYMKTLQAIANSGDGSMRGEYFGAMTYLIEKIRQVNPRIKIIIGNYFSQDSGIDEMSSFMTKYILEGNQQIADFYGFPCVNVYKYTGLRNMAITVNGSAITDMYWFCPDGVHPHTDTTGESNKLIAEVYAHELDRYI